MLLCVFVSRQGLVWGQRNCGDCVNSQSYFERGEFIDSTGEREWCPLERNQADPRNLKVSWDLGRCSVFGEGRQALGNPRHSLSDSTDLRAMKEEGLRLSFFNQ